MKTSTIVWIIVAIIVIAGLGWWWQSSQSTATPVTTTTTTTTSTPTIPGSDLTLGQGTSATLGNYLVAYNGMTLYTYAPDTAGVSTCTGTCATNWPPYTVTSTANLVAESPISGTIGTLTRADGSTQVTYNGRPLYFYAADANPGDTNGQGVDGVWYVAQP